MDRTPLAQTIERYVTGELPLAGLLTQLTEERTARLGHTELDLDRLRRCGYPEAVYGQGKTPEQVVEIVARLIAADQEALVTRADAAHATALTARFPQTRYNQVGRTLRLSPERPAPAAGGRVTILTAGTTDRPVAEEALETAAWMGCETKLIADVGVAGPHRLQAHLPEIVDSDAIVVVAGMEGALPSVVGAYVACPVIAVPTSVGYGALFGGIAPLLTMLNSCVSNVTVVNIDAGFKGGYLAGLIANRTKR
ncbi:MAG: nickel pincer cofactor biosynthesis protein LarB [Pirellulales bacterium]